MRNETKYMTHLERRNYTVIATYRDVLKNMYDLGIGKRTEFGTVITQRIIDNVEDRLTQLKKKQTHFSLVDLGISRNGVTNEEG